MNAHTTLAIEQLEILCAAGLDRIARHGSLDLRYLSELVLPKLNTVMEQVCQDIERHHSFDPSSEGVTLRVSHYTSLAAVTLMMRGLANGEETTLRLYDSAHCNDPGEGTFLVRELSSSGKYRWLDRGSEVGHAYITSFVEGEDLTDVGDDLVFWRSYGDNGKGCSLTLNVPQILLRRVKYGQSGMEETRRGILPVLDAVAPLAQANDEFASAISETIWRGLERVRYLYKESAYRHERECRVLKPGNPSGAESDDVHFEAFGQDAPLPRVRHYREERALSLRNLLTSESKLVLGPSIKDRYSFRLYLEDLKRQARMKVPALYDFEVALSTIRYRSP